MTALRLPRPLTGGASGGTVLSGGGGRRAGHACSAADAPDTEARSWRVRAAGCRPTQPTRRARRRKRPGGRTAATHANGAFTLCAARPARHLNPAEHPPPRHRRPHHLPGSLLGEDRARSGLPAPEQGIPTREIVEARGSRRLRCRLVTNLARMENLEVERRFIVSGLTTIWSTDHGINEAEGTPIAQGYLIHRAHQTLRIRVSEDQAVLTIKGRREGAVRIEYEAGVPMSFGQRLLAMCVPNIVRKTRYPVIFNDYIWVIDVFEDQNQGLILAEVELDTPHDIVTVPEWCEREVTNDPRYYNEHLAKHPYSEWRG